MSQHIRSFIFVILALATSQLAASAPHPAYPVTPTETARENRFGQTFADPYRWMENLDDPRLYPWISAENDFTTKQLSGPVFDSIQEELTNLYATKGVLKEMVVDEFLNDTSDGMRRRSPFQSKLNKRPLGGLSENEATSPKGKYKIEYQSATNGDLKIMTIVDAQGTSHVSEALLVKFVSVLWDADESGFIYCSDRDGRLQDSRYVVLVRRPNTVKPRLSQQFPTFIRTSRILFHHFATPWPLVG